MNKRPLGGFFYDFKTNSMKVYTKKGDKGTTGLIGGTRVPKHIVPPIGSSSRLSTISHAIDNWVLCISILCAPYRYAS